MAEDAAAALSRHDGMRGVDTLMLVLGDQLDAAAPALRRLERGRDAVLLIEARDEAEHVPSHRQRTTLFLAAMRHFALELLERGYRVRYVRLDESTNRGSLGANLEQALRALRPGRLLLTRAGDHRVERALGRSCRSIGVEPQSVEDESFSCPPERFRAWADDGRKSLVMEFFYREQRRRLGVLVDGRGRPEGGQWNFDAQNRQAFRSAPRVPRPYRPRPDAVTREVMRLVERTWPRAYGRMEHFRWPVNRREARRALADFIESRLSGFGTYEDAMWAGEPVLYHSLLSSSLNLKLIGPLECVDAAVEAWREGRAKLNDVEGFVRQVIGWREFIRGIYVHQGPSYLERNGLEQQSRLPAWFWTGETDMNCLRHCLGEVIDNGWGHHIPRLMVIGNFTLIAGVSPQAVHEWFLAMYVDAVDWVTAPNVLGMSQHADGGVVGTKPYAGSGRYIERMSNYCADCPYDVKRRVGERACPFNTLYWDFLLRHRRRFAGNRRMAMTLKNVDRLGANERREITTRAQNLRDAFGVGSASG